jgi:general secretion pathway protein K
MALLVILMILVILAVLVHRFTFATRVHLAAAGNLRDQLQAECMAISGLESALTVLRQDDTLEVDHLGEPWALFQGSKDISALEAMEGAFAVRVEDESAKIDINRIVNEDGATTDEFVRRQMDRLLELFGVPPDKRDALLDCLEDWIDTDDLNKLNGAEDVYYQALERPYTARNGPLRTLGELNLVKGWNEVLDARLKDGATFGDFLTVSPTEGKININTASPMVLLTLSPQIDESLAGQVVSLREEAPLLGLQLLPDPFRTKGAAGHIQFKASLFHVRSEGYYRRAVSRAEMLVARDQDQLKVIARRIE